MTTAKLPDEEPVSGSAAVQLESTLGQLVRALEQIYSGVTGAQQAHEQLVGAVAQVNQALSGKRAKESELEEQLSRLQEQAAEEREQAKREREFLVAEQERFIASLLEEHEQAILQLQEERDALRSELDSQGPPPESSASESADELTALRQELAEAQRSLAALNAERERSRAMVRRLQAQRDEAHTQLQAFTRISSHPPSVTLAEVSEVDSAWDNGTPSPPPSSGREASLHSVWPHEQEAEPPPEELRAALLSDDKSADTRESAPVRRYPSASDGAYPAEAESGIESASLRSRQGRR